MTSPPLYKYLDVQGARLTLKNRALKHAKPSDFNDTEDLTIRSIFPEDDETALKQIENGFTDILLKHLDDTPTCLNEDQRKKVALILQVFKKNPDAARLVKEAKAKGEAPEVYNVEEMKKRNRAYVDEINKLMQIWRILCLSELHDSERMWDRYGENHKGVVLRVVPNLGKDSKYQLFRRVDYFGTRPSLYKSALDFLEGGLFGDQDRRSRTSLETIIYSKTLEWEYEHEYRLAIPIMPGEKDWNTLAYHPDEISELYLGAKASDELKAEIIGLAQGVNPKISIFQMSYDASGKLLARPQ